MINNKNRRLFGVLDGDRVFCATDFSDINLHLFLVLLNNRSKLRKNQVLSLKFAQVCCVRHTKMVRTVA
ncbi:MAG: hypothetical protein CL579_00955 [Alteromonadaceae bacterium]|nr:hypothetical protein [Alteromonadaceae bacterium]MBB18828.1 hypothetical protein [Rickettsiales bacterium]